jgi:hypothetical protein
VKFLFRGGAILGVFASPRSVGPHRNDLKKLCHLCCEVAFSTLKPEGNVVNATHVKVCGITCAVGLTAGVVLRPHTELLRDEHTHESYSHIMPTMPQTEVIATSNVNYVLHAVTGHFSATGGAAVLTHTVR